MASTDEPRTVDAVETACDILDALQDLDGAGVTELANHLDMTKSAAYSHLATLRQKEYVVKEDGTYTLSLKYLDVADFIKDRIGAYDVIVDEVEDLAEKTDELAQFATHEHGRAVYLHKARGENAVQTASSIGKREYLHCIALGKAMLSCMSRDQVESVLDQHGMEAMTTNTITDRETLIEELQTVQEQGHAFDEEEMIEGLRCVAAPVYSDDRVIGAVSVSGPSSRIVGDYYREELPQTVKRSANVIEINAKFS